MNRFRLCLTFSACAIGLVVFFAVMPEGRYRRDASHYWRSVLNGTGAEQYRDKTQVDYFTQGHHGWSFCVTDVASVESQRTPEAKTLVDGMFERQPKLSRWQIARFSALTGYDPKANPDAYAWWQSVRDTISIDDAHIAAFVAERERQTTIKRSSEASNTEPDWLDLDGDDGVPFYSWLRSPQVDAALHRNALVLRKGRCAAFEIIYYPLVIFLLGYGMPRIVRRVSAWPGGCWLTSLVVVFVAYLAIVLPYLFGYSPYWGGTSTDRGTILYNAVLYAAFLPPMLVFDALPPAFIKAVVDQTTWIDKAFYPFLSYINLGHIPGESIMHGRTALVLLTMMGWLLVSIPAAFLLGLMPQARTATRTESPPDAPR